ncbi:hypothetical protein QAD02_009934 [Eretmocerus hayati]|uniref:Uncharacterized protein n=1 Tax=Eretmocerus hayati TaxID=131215 RepID=A0ACC2NB33_9HYME|nr:hypothetical protein QAD02_009934 [Eretmocerus hayati]
MATMKFSLVVLTLLLAIASSNSSNYDRKFNVSSDKVHDLIVGGRQYGDRIVHQEYVYKPSKWLGTVTLDKTFNLGYRENITQVKVLDTKADGTGAYPRVTGGGPGNSWVSLHFESQRSHGIKFNVEIYAKTRY